MTLMRRFCLLSAVMFWQGGFTFYAAVVVPVGSDVLGSHLEQGFVTRSVTNYLNMVGVAAIVLWAWEIAKTSDTGKVRRRFRWALWLVLLVTLGMLAWLHLQMDELLNAESFDILDRGRFRLLHVWYLNVSTVQWAGSLVLLVLTLFAWRFEDIGGAGQG